MSKKLASYEALTQPKVVPDAEKLAALHYGLAESLRALEGEFEAILESGLTKDATVKYQTAADELAAWKSKHFG
jgi:hypothetical protein